MRDGAESASGDQMDLLEGLRGLEEMESQAKTREISPACPSLVVFYIIIRVGSQH